MLRLAFISTLCHISVVLNCLSRVLLCVCVCVCARVILYVSVIIIQEQQTVFGASLIHLFHFKRHEPEICYDFKNKIREYPG